MKSTVYLLLIVISLAACTESNSQQVTEETTKNHNTMEHKVMSQEEAMKLIKPFYDFLGGVGTPEDVKPSYHSDWKSYYSNTGSRNMEETLGFVSGPLAQMVPDINWRIVEVYITPENQIIVRGEATGTPVGDSFMGTPIPGGKSFTFMSIDIHEVKDGKIYKTYHVEDWLNAIQQIVAE